MFHFTPPPPPAQASPAGAGPDAAAVIGSLRQQLAEQADERNALRAELADLRAGYAAVAKQPTPAAVQVARVQPGLYSHQVTDEYTSPPRVRYALVLVVREGPPDGTAEGLVLGYADQSAHFGAGELEPID